MSALNSVAVPGLLSAAAQWRLLALLHLRPTEERKTEARHLASEVEIEVPALAAAARAWCDHATEGAYLRLLGPGGLVPAREVAYRPFADPGWVLSDLRRLHEAFGFHSSADEPPDHVAVLADFVAYLLFKEAYARHGEDEQAAVTTRKVREAFVAEHLSPVASRLAERLESCGATEWAAAPRLIAARVPAPPTASMTSVEEDALQCNGCTTGIRR